MGDALIWTKALAVSVVFWTALLLLASQQLRAKLFAACVQFRCALHSRPSARECSWAKHCNRSQVVTLADEKQAAEVKASFRKRRPIGVLTRTGPDGVKRAHFFGRAEVRTLRPTSEAETRRPDPVLLYGAESSQSTTGIVSQHDLKKSKSAPAMSKVAAGGGAKVARKQVPATTTTTPGATMSMSSSASAGALCPESEEAAMSPEQKQRELRPLVIRLSTSSASTCEMTPIHESSAVSTSDEECSDDGHGDELVVHGEEKDSDAGPAPHQMLNEQHQTRRMTEAFAVVKCAAALQQHNTDDHQDIWEFAKEEKRRATSPADEHDQHAGAAGGNMDPGAGRRGAGGVSPTRNREQGRSSALLGEMAPSSSFWDLLNSNRSGAFEKHVTRRGKQHQSDREVAVACSSQRQKVL